MSCIFKNPAWAYHIQCLLCFFCDKYLVALHFTSFYMLLSFFFKKFQKKKKKKKKFFF